MFSIVITGYIPVQKIKEFKQHMRQMTGRPGSDVFDLDVYQDMLHEDLYRVEMTFNDKQEMFSYMKSDNFAMITGSFKTLGILRDQHIETFSDLKEKTK